MFNHLLWNVDEHKLIITESRGSETVRPHGEGHMSRQEDCTGLYDEKWEKLEMETKTGDKNNVQSMYKNS